MKHETWKHGMKHETCNEHMKHETWKHAWNANMKHETYEAMKQNGNMEAWAWHKHET
jgi:hypothetical protein